MKNKIITLRLNLIISFLFCLFSINKVLGYTVNNTYLFAAGENNEIEITWDYTGDKSDLLGCNLFRSEPDTGQAIQINPDLIISATKDFYYRDTIGIIDTLRYFYYVQYIFSSDTFYSAGYTGAFKKIDFTILNEQEIKVLLIPRKTGNYIYILLIDDAIAGTDVFIDSICGIANPSQMQSVGNVFTYQIFLPVDTILEYHGPFVITVDYLFGLLQGTGIKENDESDPEIINVNVFPNPFIYHTYIQLQLRKPMFIDLSIFNLLGQHVKTIYHGFMENGLHDFSWEGIDEKGIRMPNGTYIYKIQYSGGHSSDKLIMLN